MTNFKKNYKLFQLGGIMLTTLLHNEGCRTIGIIIFGGKSTDSPLNESFTDFCTELRCFLNPNNPKKQRTEKFTRLVRHELFYKLENWLYSISKGEFQTSFCLEAEEMLVIFQRARGTALPVDELMDSAYTKAKQVSPG